MMEAKLYSDNLLWGDPRWMMYPGDGYEYVALKSGYTGVRNQSGELFAIETDGLVIVRLWLVLADGDRLQLNTASSVGCQAQVLEPVHSKVRLPRLDWNLITKWAGPLAKVENPLLLSMTEAGTRIQAGEIRCGYDRAIHGGKQGFKPSDHGLQFIKDGFKELGEAIAANTSESSMEDSLKLAGEMLKRIASHGSVFPSKPPAALKGIVTMVLAAAQRRRRTLASVALLHNSLELVAENAAAARVMREAFNPTLAFTGSPPLPSYNKLADAFTDLRAVAPEVGAYVLDGRGYRPQ